MQSAYDGETKTVEILVKNGAQPDIQDNWGNTPLMKSIWEGHTTITSILLEEGASPNQ